MTVMFIDVGVRVLFAVTDSIFIGILVVNHLRTNRLSVPIGDIWMVEGGSTREFLLVFSKDRLEVELVDEAVHVFQNEELTVRIL